MLVDRESALFSLSLRDTEILKGIALMLLLCHHLFFEGNMPVDDFMIHGQSAVQMFGGWCKLCVAMFVFLSGYGLTVSADRKGSVGNLCSFYKRRYLKLMVNYWFIYLIFVPMGIFLFGRTFHDVYDGSWARAVLDFFGLHAAVTGNSFGYNPTWWFYGCIIVLYALFPALYKVRRYWWIVVPLTLLVYYFGYRVPFVWSAYTYLPTFIAGMYMASSRIEIPRFSERWQRISYAATMLFILAYLAVHRLIHPAPYLWDVVIVCMMVICYAQIRLPEKLAAALSFLGKHSFNIFLFHTFIFAFYFRNIIYWTTNPILIFLTLLLSCLVISVALEWLKRVLGIEKMLQKSMK